MDWGGSCISGGVATIRGLECLFQNILTYIVGILVVVVFIMLVIGGFKYLTAGGDPKATADAKNTITYALAGVVALILAWLLLKLIFDYTGIDVTIFRIPS